MCAGNKKHLQAGRTLNEVASQDKHVLNNVGALGGRLEDAGAVIRAQNKSCITGRVRLDRLSTLFFADLVYRLDLLEVLVGDCLCSDGSFPRDWSRPDVVLERQDICRRVERHVGVWFAGVNAWYNVPVSGSSIALGNSVLKQQEQPARSDVVGPVAPAAFPPGINRRDFPIFACCRHRWTFFDTIKNRDQFPCCRQFIMTSLKRSYAADSAAPNLSSKVYIRSTKSGKVQKIVRELYLREDIPCSSRLCARCLEIAPTDYHNKGNFTIADS
jgi:hypothetical protein